MTPFMIFTYQWISVIGLLVSVCLKKTLQLFVHSFTKTRNTSKNIICKTLKCHFYWNLLFRWTHISIYYISNESIYFGADTLRKSLLSMEEERTFCLFKKKEKEKTFYTDFYWSTLNMDINLTWMWMWIHPRESIFLILILSGFSEIF